MEGGGPSTEQRVPSSSSSGGEEELDELEKYLLGHAAEGLPPPPKAPGTRVAAPLDRQVQELCLQLCEWQFNRSFPGSQPVSLDRRNLKDIVKNIKGYYISEKSDGTRFLLLIMHDGSYLVDRSFRVTKVELRFPFPARKATPASPPVLDRTLIDGELVCDVVEGNKQVLTFLMYDIVAWMGVNVAKRDLPDRLKIIQNDVLGPRKEDKSHDYSKEPFKLRLKDFFEIKYLPYVFKEVIPHLHHQNDGIIFTPVRFPYTPGTCKQMLKWKPSAINSVDFELKVEYRNRQRGYSLLAAERLAKRFYAWITFTPEQKQMFDNDKQASGKIVECVWDPSWKTWIPAARAETWDEGEWQAGGWRFLRIRDDKDLASDVSVIERIQRSRADNLESGELLSVLCGGEHGSPHHHHHPQPHLRRSGSTEFRSSSTDGINSSLKRKRSTEEAASNHPQHKQKQEHHQHHQQTNLSSNAVLSSSFSNDINNNNSTTKEKKLDEPHKAKERTEDKQKDEGEEEEEEEEAPTQPAPSKKQRIDFLLSGTVPDSATASLDPHSFFTSSSSSSASSSSLCDVAHSLPSTQSVWDELPNELLAVVFSFLEPKHLCQCFTVNKRWSAVAQDNLLWIHFFRQHFGEEEAHAIQHQEGASSSSSSWLQTFRERSENSFCFHPLLACRSFLINQKDYKTIARQNHKGHCPKAVLSSERQLRQSRQWLAKRLPAPPSAVDKPLPAPPPEPDLPPHLIRGLQDSNYIHTPAFKQEQAEQEGKAMFMDWAGKVTEIEFRSRTRCWEIGLFHDQKSFLHFNSSSDYFNLGIGRDELPPIPFVALSLGECLLIHRPPGDESGKIKQDPIDLPSKTSAWEWCIMVVTVDAREGRNKVRFVVNGKEVGVLPLPPHPFVMGFNTGYSGPDLTIAKSSILRS